MSNVINILAEPGDYIEVVTSGVVFKVKKEFSTFTLVNRKPLDITIHKMFNAGWLNLLTTSSYTGNRAIKITPEITLIKNN